MSASAVVDAGPLVASLVKSETYGEWVRAQFAPLTLDREFRIYRRSGRQVIPLICPRDQEALNSE